MNVKSCKSCGKLFNYLVGPPICESCKDALENKFQVVKEYVREHKDIPINQVSEECEVSVKQIKQWIREERLVLVEGSGVFIECEVCGVPILTGRFCNKCKTKMQDSLRSAYPAKKQSEPTKTQKSNGNRMRYLDF